MAQEVQTNLDYKAELNLIEWVWHQEGKVREHSQIQQAFGYECEVYGSVACHASDSDRQSTTNKDYLGIVSMDGTTEFKIVDWGLRVPLAWAYLAEITTGIGTNTMKQTTYVKVDGKTIYQNTTTGTKVTETVVLNLGRYNILEHRGSMYFTGSWNAHSASTLTLKLKKL